MSLDDEPKPSEYGLDEEARRYFSSPFDIEDRRLLPGVLAWVSFFALFVLLPFDHGPHSPFVWPVLLLYCVPGLIAGVVINRLREALFEGWKRRHKLYGNWESYLAANTEWRRGHLKELEEESARQARLRKQEDAEARRRLDWWKSLDGKQFEKEVTGLLRQRGYEAKVTPYSGDGGVDITVRTGAKRIIVQCKAHRSYISPGVVRELYGTMIHEEADEAWLVTTNGFYSGAHAFARDKPIKLITIAELLRWETKEQRGSRAAS